MSKKGSFLRTVGFPWRVRWERRVASKPVPGGVRLWAFLEFVLVVGGTLSCLLGLSFYRDTKMASQENTTPTPFVQSPPESDPTQTVTITWQVSAEYTGGIYDSGEGSYATPLKFVSLPSGHIREEILDSFCYKDLPGLGNLIAGSCRPRNFSLEYDPRALEVAIGFHWNIVWQRQDADIASVLPTLMTTMEETYPYLGSQQRISPDLCWSANPNPSTVQGYNCTIHDFEVTLNVTPTLK